MINFAYTRIRSDWHKLVTPQGVFFGISRYEVEARASRAAQLAQIAREEQARTIDQADRRRRVYTS